MPTSHVRWLLLVLAACILAAACGDPGDPGSGEPSPSPLAGGPSAQAATPSPGPSSEVAATVADVLTRSAGFAEFTDALEQADLLDTLREDGPFTVFAPSVGAFDDAAVGRFEEILDDPDDTATLLLAHVVPERWTLEDLSRPGRQVRLETLAGTTLRVQRDDDDVVTVNGLADITQPGLDAGNGVVHGIDQVVVPAELDAPLGAASER